MTRTVALESANGCSNPPQHRLMDLLGRRPFATRRVNLALCDLEALQTAQGQLLGEVDVNKLAHGLEVEMERALRLLALRGNMASAGP